MAEKKTLTANEMLAELASSRKKRRIEPRVRQGIEWEEVDIIKYSYKVKEFGEVRSHAVSRFGKGTSMVSIFIAFVTPILLKTIWDKIPERKLKFRTHGHLRTVNNGEFSAKLLYKYLAVELRIIALQQTPLESRKSKRPLRDNIQSAKEHFDEVFPLDPAPGINLLERLITWFNITASYEDELSRNFQDALIWLGQFAIGDEKLLHAVGHDNRVQLIPSKPDRLGFWFYELVVRLRNGLVFIIFYKLMQAERSLGDSNPIWFIMSLWVNVVKRIGCLTDCKYDKNTIIVCDSYYMTKASMQVCEDAGVMVVGSCKEGNFNDLVAMVKHSVKSAGDWAGVYSHPTTRMFLYRWDRDDNIGKKYCYSNAFRKLDVATRGNDGTIPAYDLYKLAFNACDKFNRKLHDRKFPHRCGGGTKGFGDGHQHKFAISIILQNTINLYCDVNDIDHKINSFEFNVLLLSDELYAYATSLN
jgi:hypothetical protein